MNPRQMQAVTAAVGRAIHGADGGETPEQAARAAGWAFTEAGGDWTGASLHDIRSFQADFAYHEPMAMAMTEYYRRKGIPDISTAHMTYAEMTRAVRQWSEAFCEAWPR